MFWSVGLQRCDQELESSFNGEKIMQPGALALARSELLGSAFSSKIYTAVAFYNHL